MKWARDDMAYCSGCGEEQPIAQLFLIFSPATGDLRKRNGFLERDQMYCCDECFIPPPIDLAKAENRMAYQGGGA